MTSKTLSVEKVTLYVPTLEEIRDAFDESLKLNFEQVSVKVVECPDLTLPPFGLAAPGLSGHSRIADVGGVPNLTPVPEPEKVYSLTDVLKVSELECGAVIGPGAGNSHFVGVNSEMMANIHVGESGLINRSFVSKVDTESNCHLDSYRTTDFGLMANLFISEGQAGPVIEVRAKVRTGELNFISCLRESLQKRFGPSKQIVAMGGTFFIEPFSCDADVDKWLHYYDFSAPLTVVSAFISEDIPDLHLRIEHSHGWSDHGEGGHYHYDVTPEEIEYLGYFNLAHSLYRIDDPTT